MESLQLTKQVGIFEDIKTLCTNYKKDSVTRKTVEYLEKRLANLEKLWVNFDELHQILVENIVNKNIGYFENGIYEKTKDLYESTKKNILDLLASQRKQQQNKLDFDLTGLMDEETENDVKKLITQQERNFKALNKAMSKININSITEKWEFEEHLTTLKSKWEQIDKKHWELEDELKASSLGSDYNEKYEAIETKYDSIKRDLNSKIWSTIHYQRSAPKIDVPEFSGNYIHWITFKDIFMETIHNNPSISKAQKMQYLKTKLKGEAERLVHHLSISADNYDSCWEILSHRYNNRRMQFTSFMSTMQHLPAVQQPNANNLKRMHDVITECLNGLGNMGIEVSSWGPMIVYNMSQKLDSTTLNEYTKETQNNRELPDLEEFLSFLELKFLAYETAKSCVKDSADNKTQRPYNKGWNNNYKPNTFSNKQQDKNKLGYTKTFHASYGQCPLCYKDHVLMQCDKFVDMDIALRNKTVSKLKVCKNCLYSHGSFACNSKKTCRECNSKHHTLLHMNKFTYSTSNNKKEHDRDSNPGPSTSTQPGAHHLATDGTEILLTTVQVKVQSADGSYITLRGLLDQGSQINLISENAAQLLRLPRNKFDAAITGIGSTSRNCKGLLHLNCKSVHSDFTFNVQALILSNLTNKLPSRTFQNTGWAHLQNLKLADSNYNVSGTIDLLLGADVYSDIILDGVLKGDQQSPIAQQTRLGWILCGKLKTFNCHLTLANMPDLAKYWESEDISQSSQDIKRDDQCETHYNLTTKRCPDGKYIVKMPMVQSYEQHIGYSKPAAIAQFLRQEKRLPNNKQLFIMYKNFMNEYLELQHMEPAIQTTLHQSEYYLPHHGILRDQSTTTKLRVVFNASQKTSSGKSLNSLMEKGANLQKDIQALILKWRTYRYAFTADIEKMYRCLWINDEQKSLQRIIWRNSPNEQLREYALCTVTYGTKCAPWLAMRTLLQLADDDGHLYPEAANLLRNEFYVDDLTSGHNCLESAKKLQTDLIKLLQGGGMNLRKWSSNCVELLEQLNEDQISTTNFDFKDEASTKTLGLGWNPNSDTFTFSWNFKPHSKKPLTKRLLLSQISQLYDPLGWFSPVTIRAKLIFQRVWTEELTWDESLPTDIQDEWLKLKSQVQELKTVQISRWIGSIRNNIELLAFSDASEKAYSCVIYTRALNETGQPVLCLLVAKTRVAPLAQKLSLPRLELSGALLLTQLVDKVTKSLPAHNITVWAWCDSKVVLAWLNGEPSKYEKYVENRVTKITRVVPACQWSNIESKNNPADCATRGLYPKQLVNTQLWWSGPEMLKTFTGKSEEQRCLFTTNVEEKRKVPTLSPTDNIICDLLIKHCTLSRVARVIAWITRFRTQTDNARTMKKLDSLHNYLTIIELDNAMTIITRNIQRIEFNIECDLLLKGQPVTTKSTIRKLCPYLDEEGIMRVGGRLNKTNLPSGMKNPAIIPRKSRFTQLLINQAHAATLHGGARLTLAYIRQQYWIVGGNRAVKTQLRQCVRCHRFKTKENYQLMADLPSPRVTPSRPFTHTGVDFTGHVEVKLSKGRGVRTSKGYIAKISIGKIQLIHNEWRLLMYYNLSTYWSGVQKFENYIQNILNFCKSLEPKYCETTIRQLAHKFDLLQHYNNILLASHEHLSGRNKRGWIDGVGYVANSLFGILDQRFAKQYQEYIQNIQDNENYLLQLVRNQTSIVEIEKEILKKNEQNVNNQFSLINKFMNETDIKFAKIESGIEVAMATSYFNSASLAAHLLLTNLKNIQETLFNTLLDTYKGRIDVHLLTPVNLIQQLTIISGQLPKTLTLPVTNIQHAIKDMYELIYVKARVTESYFMYELHIPLASDEDFVLYQIFPLPLKNTYQTNETTAVLVSSRYIAVNLEKNTYISLNEKELNHCVQQQTDNFVCILNIPVFNLQNTNVPCEAKLLGHQSILPCITKKTECDSAWIELHNTNAWLVTCCDSCNIRTVCDGHQYVIYCLSETRMSSPNEGLKDILSQ